MHFGLSAYYPPAIQAGGYCNGNVMVLDGGFLMNHAGV